MHLLVVNCGSSTVKLRVIAADDQIAAAHDLTNPDPATLMATLGEILDHNSGVTAVGHRVVHGGEHYTQPIVLDERIDDVLDRLGELAPLHNPPALSIVRTIAERWPSLPQVACFDTAFHAGMPVTANTYAVPWEWREHLGIRRFGFHGLSHAWTSRRAADLLERRTPGFRVVTAHLGSGASLAAVADGLSVDTTMGFSPLEGLVMATRPGNLDAGVLLWAQRHLSMSVDDLEDTLNHRCGLAGMSGGSGDFRQVIAAVDRGDRRAERAYGVYLHRLRQEIACMAASLGGLDALVFTGGAGWASSRLRADACAGLEFLGLRLDPWLNAHQTDDGVISPKGQQPTVLVIETREDLEIARLTRQILQA